MVILRFSRVLCHSRHIDFYPRILRSSNPARDPPNDKIPIYTSRNSRGMPGITDAEPIHIIFRAITVNPRVASRSFGRRRVRLPAFSIALIVAG